MIDWLINWFISPGNHGPEKLGIKRNFTKRRSKRKKRKFKEKNEDKIDGLDSEDEGKVDEVDEMDEMDDIDNQPTICVDVKLEQGKTCFQHEEQNSN